MSEVAVTSQWLTGLAHYWSPVGGGEVARFILSPLCDRTIRRHRDSFVVDKTDLLSSTGVERVTVGAERCLYCTYLAPMPEPAASAAPSEPVELQTTEVDPLRRVLCLRWWTTTEFTGLCSLRQGHGGTRCVDQHWNASKPTAETNPAGRTASPYVNARAHDDLIHQAIINTITGR